MRFQRNYIRTHGDFIGGCAEDSDFFMRTQIRYPSVISQNRKRKRFEDEG